MGSRNNLNSEVGRMKFTEKAHGAQKLDVIDFDICSIARTGIIPIYMKILLVTDWQDTTGI